MTLRFLDIIQLLGTILSFLGVTFAAIQLVGQRRLLRQISELLLRSTKLIYETSRAFSGDEAVLVPSDLERIVKLWDDFQCYAGEMYQRDREWKDTIKELTKGDSDEH